MAFAAIMAYRNGLHECLSDLEAIVCYQGGGIQITSENIGVAAAAVMSDVDGLFDHITRN